MACQSCRKRAAAMQRRAQTPRPRQSTASNSPVAALRRAQPQSQSRPARPPRPSVIRV